MRKTDNSGWNRRAARVVVVAGCLGALPAPAQMMTAEDFVPFIEQGFGDRYNSYTWSMQWWNGKLYVGTLRSMYCVQQATLARWLPNFSFIYPPADPEFACTDDPADLPLQGEIWRWSPDSGIWDRVYQSPKDVPVPGDPSRTVARDIGLRTMTLYTEADGTEALYVGAFCTESFLEGVNPPRLLRSTDGDTFEAVPQDPGTFLGSLRINGFPFNGFRSLAVHDGKMFVVASEGFAGFGGLIVSEDPGAGNDAWTFAAPADEAFYQLASYNGHLYAGGADTNGFVLVKTDAQGPPPYEFDLVIPQGGHLRPDPSMAVVSLFEYKDRLYVGMDRPAEIYRVNPDDSWDLIAGEPRLGPRGMIRPLSGLGAGFDTTTMLHIWRMQDAYGVLYTGTMDQTTKWSVFPPLAPILEPIAGFDLYGTENGYYYTMVTRNGLLTKFDEGLRQFAYSPEYGLIAGSANNRYGCNAWQGIPDATRMPGPDQLDAELMPGWGLLSWEPVPGASRYHVYRSLLTGNDRAYHRIVTTTLPHHGDRYASTFPAPMHYYVVAEDASGRLSIPSNVARIPNLAERINFSRLQAHLQGWNATPEAMAYVQVASHQYFRQGNFGGAGDTLRLLRDFLLDNPDQLSPAWRVEDAEILIRRLARRTDHARQGFVPWWWLLL